MFRLKLTHNLPSNDQEEDQGINQQLSNQLWYHHRAWNNLLHQHLCPSNSSQLKQPAALQPKVQQPPPAAPASQQPVRRRITQKGPGPAATKLHNILEKARSTHELEVAVNAAEEELRDAKESLKDVHLQAYYEDDLSLFVEEDIKKAMLKEGESLQGTYEPSGQIKLHQATA